MATDADVPKHYRITSQGTQCTYFSLRIHSESRYIIPEGLNGLTRTMLKTHPTVESDEDDNTSTLLEIVLLKKIIKVSVGGLAEELLQAN